MPSIQYWAEPASPFIYGIINSGTIEFDIEAGFDAFMDGTIKIASHIQKVEKLLKNPIFFMYLCRYHEVEVLLSFPPQPNISFSNVDALETTYTTGSTKIPTVSPAKSSTPTVESLCAANTLSIMYLLVVYILQE